MAQLKARVTYSVRPGATPDAELSALSAVYKFILRCASKRDRSLTSGPNDAMKGSRHDRATAKYTR